MFLKELWNFNKMVALVLVLFILSWGYINYKQGAVAAPLFQYGMYAGKFFIKDTQEVTKLYANNQAIDFTKYSMVERDMMQISLDNYIAGKTMNDTVFRSMKRILSHIGIGQLMQEKNYVNNINDKDFMQWYKKLLEKILGYPINTLAAYKQKYSWQNGRLFPIDTPLKINFVVIN